MPTSFTFRPERLRAITFSVVLSSLLLSGCGGAATAPGQTQSTPNSQIEPVFAQAGLDDTQAVQAQADHAIKVEITVTAPVKKLLPDDTRGLPHQKFLLELSNGSTVLVAHDTKYAPHVPLSAGDRPTIHGEYIWNARGGVLHWTHRSDTPRHEGGWIQFNGVKYE